MLVIPHPFLRDSNGATPVKHTNEAGRVSHSRATAKLLQSRALAHIFFKGRWEVHPLETNRPKNLREMCEATEGAFGGISLTQQPPDDFETMRDV